MQTNFRRWGLRLLLVLFDIFAVNFSYYIALVLRFYVNGEFHLAGTLFLPLFLKFAPYYTVCCLIVFFFFKLYNGMWRYAGYNDVNRIVMANAVTCAIQVIGTLLFIRRMPISYYGIGAVIQFLLVAASRLSYRFLQSEFSKLSQRDSGNVMIIGAGETARKILRLMQTRPVCVIDFHNRDTGLFLNGLPVVGGIESIEEAVGKYDVKSAVIADPLMPAEMRTLVKSKCKALGIDIQDISTQALGSSVAFRSFLEHASGSVEIVLDGKVRKFDNSEQAAQEYAGKYVVSRVYGKNDSLVIELENGVLNDMNESWIQDYEKETGESVSFF